MHFPHFSQSIQMSTRATFHDAGLDCERSWHLVPGSSDLSGAMSYALYSNEMEQLAAEEHSDQDCDEDGVLFVNNGALFDIGIHWFTMVRLSSFSVRTPNTSFFGVDGF